MRTTTLHQDKDFGSYKFVGTSTRLEIHEHLTLHKAKNTSCKYYLASTSNLITLSNPCFEQFSSSAMMEEHNRKHIDCSDCLHIITPRSINLLIFPLQRENDESP